MKQQQESREVAQWMSTAQAAELWGKPKRTVQDWCQKEYVVGCVQQGRAYALPARVWEPYLCKATTGTKIYWHLLEAVNERKSLGAKAFRLEEDEFEAYVRVLCELQFILPLAQKGHYVLHAKGMEFLHLRKREQQEMLTKLVQIGLSALPMLLAI